MCRQHRLKLDHYATKCVSWGVLTLKIVAPLPLWRPRSMINKSFFSGVQVQGGEYSYATFKSLKFVH